MNAKLLFQAILKFTHHEQENHYHPHGRITFVLYRERRQGGLPSAGYGISQDKGWKAVSLQLAQHADGQLGHQLL